MWLTGTISIRLVDTFLNETGVAIVCEPFQKSCYTSFWCREPDPTIFLPFEEIPYGGVRESPILYQGIT